jgi:phosphatidylethanolamine-binding protein
VQNEDLQKLQKDYPNAFEGSQNVQDLKDRLGFNAQKFLEEKNLKVEAVTFMLVDGTLKSTIDNLSMTAQAAANKVSV